jgi:hypothetical protein
LDWEVFARRGTGNRLEMRCRGAAEPIESSEPTEPADPMDAIDLADPIERIEPSLRSTGCNWSTSATRVIPRADCTSAARAGDSQVSTQ